MSRTSVTIETRDGTCPASVFRPEGGGGPWPAVIMYMDGVGIRDALFEMGERLAAHGYAVLLPDLFYRAGPYTAPDFSMFADPVKRDAWMSKYGSTASQANIMSDTSAFIDFLSSQPDINATKIGTTGYCLGGRLSLYAAGHYPDRVVAAASYHGSRLATDQPDSPHLLAPRMKARVFVAGAIEDASFPDDMKQRLDDALTAAGVSHEVTTFNAKHGWVPAGSPVHDPVEAEHHWQTLFALFDGALKN